MTNVFIWETTDTVMKQNKCHKQPNLDAENMANDEEVFAFAVIGREHVGKTSLITALCGQEQNASECPVMCGYHKNKAIVLFDFPPFGTSGYPTHTFIERFDLDKRLYQGLILVCDQDLTDDDICILSTLRSNFRRVIIVRNKVGSIIQLDRTLCSEGHNPKDVFSQCKYSTRKHFSACRPDRIFVLDSFDTDRFQFKDLDDYLQNGHMRSRNHGRRPRGSHLDKGNYTPSKCDGPLSSDETFSCYTVECQDESVEATGGLLSELTLQTKEADDDMSYDAGASDVGIGFDLRKWQYDISDVTADEEEVKRFLPELNQPSARRRRDLVRRTRNDLARWETEKLHIAVTGNSGVGKSSFINAIRGLHPGDAGWAPVDVVEGTMRPTQYNHPVFPNILLWDLPGVGTKNFRRETYMAQVEFERYDFYIIICAGRFTENDLWLAETIHQKGKTFFFVRTKVQQEIDNARRVYAGESVFDENVVLRKMRKNCSDSLPKSRGRELFLIDNYEPQLYDFGKLAMAIIHQSPHTKKEAATFGMCLLTEDVIKAKEEELKKRIWKTALMVAVTEASPIDFLGISSTDEYLLKEAHFYREQFQLTDAHLEKYASAEGKTKQEFVECKQLKSTILSHRAKIPMLLKMLGKSNPKVNFILLPVLTAVTSGAVSFGTAMKFLRVALNVAVEDVRKINRAMKSHTR